MPGEHKAEEVDLFSRFRASAMGGVMFELRSAGRVRVTLLSVPPGVPDSRDRATCNGPLQGEQAVSGKLKEDQC